jgi:hypothetical protein
MTVIQIPNEKIKSSYKLVIDLNDRDIDTFKSKINSYDWIT